MNSPVPAATAAPFILSIGVSSGRDPGRILDDLRRDEDLVVIVVMEEPEPAKALGWLSQWNEHLVVPVDGEQLEGGRWYFIPPSLLASLDDGRFCLTSRDKVAASSASIDSLFVSQSSDCGARAIGVMVGDGTGSGVLGMAAIKQAGGLTLAVDPDADTEELRESAHPAALADELLSCAEVGQRVQLHLQHLRSHLAEGHEKVFPDEAELLGQVAAVLRERTGHDFHGYKRATFMRRVRRRMQVLRCDSPPGYIESLKALPDEAQQLLNDLLIGVTEFFRDEREFAFVQAHVIPALFEGKSRSDVVRVWVLGCSTGEEVYSLAMLLREEADQRQAPPGIQIFATDIDGGALAAARVGRYPRTIEQRIPVQQLERWFVQEADTYLVKKELRELCVFSQHSIVRDPPFSRLDMVSCRNLLIYMDAELQAKVIPVFHFALKPGGYLFLGTSENVSRHPKLFEPVDRTFRVFRRTPSAVRLNTQFPLFPGAVSATPHVATRPAAPSQTLVRVGERIAERYAPAFAVVDSFYDVVHFSAQVGRYIHPGGGAPSLNLLNLVHRSLRLDLRKALGRAASDNLPVKVEDLSVFDDNGVGTQIDLIVEPANDTATSARGFVVFFMESRGGLEAPSEVERQSSHDEHVRGLEHELRVTRERLQAMIEELESTNEELKSSNEEYQSLNEELQSANEELETAKEELQSVNEELTTVNSELGHRVQELAHSNSDLKNLLESTQIGTIFLDNDLRVTNFTPAITQIFPLTESDIKRPIGHLRSRVSYESMQDDVRTVLRTLVPVDREVTETEGRSRFMVRVLPYRSVDNFIGGAVITFTDVTRIAEAERRQREEQIRLRALIEGIPQLVWRSQDGGQWSWSSPQWAAFTGQSETFSIGLGWLEAVHPEDREATLQAWAAAPARNAMEVEHRIFEAGAQTYRWFHTRSAPVVGDDGSVIEWLGTSTEVDRMRRFQEAQRVMVAELQHRTRNLITVVHSIARQTLATSSSLDDFRDQFGARLQALSRVQGILSQSDSEPVLLEDLLRMELDALNFNDDRRVQVGGPKVSLRKSAVQILALALHELATNARKHGALAVSDGFLEVTWHLEGERVVLTWVERGALPADNVPAATTGRGYGRRLIEEALPYALDARTRFVLNDTGVHCVIDLPLDIRT